MAHNWDLLAARGELATAGAQLRSAREFPNPELSWTTSKVTTGARAAADRGVALWDRPYDTAFGLGQLIEVDGKRGDRQRSARAELAAARARLADAERRLRADVTRAYVAVALADANRRITGESARFLRDEARIAEVRLSAGDISRSDRDRIENAAASLEADSSSAEADAQARRIALEQLLGVAHPTGDLGVADSLEALAERAPEAPAGAGGDRADVAAARAVLVRAEFDLRLQRALRVPDPTLFLQVEHQPPDTPETYGAGLSLPLPLWNRNRGAIEAARVAREQAARDLAQAQSQAAADAAAARARFAEAIQRWHRFRDEIRPRSEDIRRAVSLAYERGGASLLDLLEAQRSDNDARLAAMQAASDAATAAADLTASTQTLNAENAAP